jgi:DNA-binding transcriptional LysR family regulator
MARLDAITLKQLRALSAVASHGSITRAAEAIHLTPPAVHTQLRQLAANMGAEMLTRGDGGKMELTTEGEVVLEAIRRIEVELGACMRSVAELRDGRAGLVQLGVVSTGKYFAPSWWRRSSRSFPISRSSSSSATAARPSRRSKPASADGDHGPAAALSGQPFRAGRPAPACADRAARPFPRRPHAGRPEL